MAMITGSAGTSGWAKHMHSIANEVSSRTKRMTVHPYKVVKKEDGFETLQGVGAIIRRNGHSSQIRAGGKSPAGRRVYLATESERETQTTRISVRKGIEGNVGVGHEFERGISLVASQGGKSFTTGTSFSMLG
ncbi:hypothetical protein KJ693_05295 [bacterium]|nr:hypothetical protein [bacterium]MBU1614714.1 hypothetical protein [bacterium]